MKKYLLIGLAILMGSNLAVLGGVVLNRSGEATSQLTLTERELSLPYYMGAKAENSGISLSLNWRVPSKGDKNYYPYGSKKVVINKDQLLALGFDKSSMTKGRWSEPIEMYWALEFDGALYKLELKKIAVKYKEALLAYKEQENEEHKRQKKQSRDQLAREKKTNSRLFFIEASASYEALVTKFSGKEDILIVKGLAKYYYNKKDKTYNLSLNNLSVSNIMVPLDNRDVFTGLNRLSWQDNIEPRYIVKVQWGSRLEPMIIDVKRLSD